MGRESTRHSIQPTPLTNDPVPPLESRNSVMPRRFYYVILTEPLEPLVRRAVGFAPRGWSTVIGKVRAIPFIIIYLLYIYTSTICAHGTYRESRIFTVTPAAVCCSQCSATALVGAEVQWMRAAGRLRGSLPHINV